jgi:hypothetical protein
LYALTSLSGGSRHSRNDCAVDLRVMTAVSMMQRASNVDEACTLLDNWF